MERKPWTEPHPTVPSDEFFLPEDSAVISVQRIDYRPFYDSDWRVKLQVGNEVQDCIIVRRHLETTAAMAKLVHPLKDLDAIRSLDERKHIYYD